MLLTRSQLTTAVLGFRIAAAALRHDLPEEAEARYTAMRADAEDILELAGYLDLLACLDQEDRILTVQAEFHSKESQIRAYLSSGLKELAAWVDSVLDEAEEAELGEAADAA